MVDRIAQKYDRVLDQLDRKINKSQVKVPGFIMSLSGTDSILAFMLVYDALVCSERENALYGIHYTNGHESWFERECIPWLKKECPYARIEVQTPLGGNQDQLRWADLHLRALNKIDGDKVTALDPEYSYWTAGTINATEWELGKYSTLANSVSIQPIRSFWKTEIMYLCERIGVPKIALENARLPDCFCGRDELAAENIELIDQILTHDAAALKADPALLDLMIRYVHDLKSANAFKKRIPYLV